MNKKIITSVGISLLCFGLNAQDNGKNVKIPCNTYEVMESAFNVDPNLKAKYNLIQSQMDLEYKQAIENISNARVAATVYTVPVVFHILHQNGPENIPDADVYAAMNQINKDYGKLGSDISAINPTFAPLYVDAEIRFVLAKKDPNGNCTNGIIRHYDANTNWSQLSTAGYAYSGTGTGRWPVNKYLNIYIVKCISGPSTTCPPTGAFVVGYTYLPGSSPGTSADAIVYKYDYLSTGTEARALSHEIGHWLNLQHTFGSTNNPEVACGTDGVGDTPDTKGYFAVNQCPSHGLGSFTGCSPTENDENFMDYGSCPKMFTQGQVTRMRTALTSATAGRNNLWSATNLLATGITSTYTCAPVADLKSNKTIICAGNSITHTSLAQYGTSGSISWSFQGGTPATSTATAPVVVYNTPGTYSVSLTATNPYGTNTMTKTSYITVVNGTGGYTAPYTHDFDVLFGVPSDMPVTNGNSGSASWQQNASYGAIGTPKSIYLNNSSYTSTGGHIDYIETPIYDFHNTTNVSMSFYYAYAKKISTQADTFKLQISTDCGGTWQNILGAPSANVMASNSAGTTSTPLNPSTAQWHQHIISSSLFSATTPNPNLKPSVKFRFWFKSDVTAGSSNNLYIDQINLSGTVGLNELENQIQLQMFPNPTNSSATVNFTIYNNEKVKINIVDLVGRLVEESDKISITENNASYTINKNGNLSKGVYFVNLYINDSVITKKLIIE